MKVAGFKNLRSMFLAAVMLILPFAVFADAQTSKKKKKRKTPAVSAVQVPTVTADPMVVSRAVDFQNETLPAAATDETPVSAADTERDRQLASMAAKIKKLESQMKEGYDEKQKRMLLNLDILTRAEQRSESLRKQRFELIEKENQIQSRLDQIEIDIRPDIIERAIAVAGTLRPEELREARQKSLDSERKNLQSLLTQVQTTRASLDASVNGSDELVQKLRARMETEINAALDDTKPANDQ
ncbi:MAG: hypothetical protein ABI878_15655 [Acidobacteriota bacterium]